MIYCKIGNLLYFFVGTSFASFLIRNLQKLFTKQGKTRLFTVVFGICGLNKILLHFLTTK